MQEASCSDDENTLPDATVTQEELVALQNSTSSAIERDSSAFNAAQNVIKHYLSGMFMGEVAESLQVHRFTVDNDDSVSIPGNPQLSSATEDARSSARRRAGLPGWEYLSAFAKVEIVVNNVDETLAPLFLKEVNAVLSNICEEVRDGNCDGHVRDSKNIDLFVPSRLKLFKALLPNSVLEKVREAINRVLVSRNRSAVEISELMAIIAQHVLCSSYGESVTTVSSGENGGFSVGCCC